MVPKKLECIYEYRDGKLSRKSNDAEYYEWLASLPDRTLLTVTFGRKKWPKTQPQLGYYHAVILPYATQGFMDAGTNTMGEVEMKFQVGVEMTDELSDMSLKRAYQMFKVSDEFPLKRKMSDEEMSGLIDFSIRWLSQNLNVAVPPPPAEIGD